LKRHLLPAAAHGGALQRMAALSSAGKTGWTPKLDADEANI